MRLFALVFFLCASEVWLYGAVTTVESIREVATHHQTRVIDLSVEGSTMKVNAFCLNDQDQIVAACGTGPGEIRVIATDGETIHKWSVDVKPESVHVASDQSIIVGGDGKLFRFDSKGSLLNAADSPHARALREDRDSIREAAIKSLQPRESTLGSRISMYELIISNLEAKSEKGELNEQETKMLELLPKTLAEMQKQLQEQEEKEKKEKEDGDKPKGPSEADIQSRMDMMLASKMRISSITCGGDHLFVTTRATTGYGFDVWKVANDFSTGEILIKGLSGCCGQMDVQCCRADASQSHLFVAENSRGRVVQYDLDGKEITHWGKKDRSGVEGFTSCCNPMNVCFNSKGEVFTAEASTGRVKRFSAEGKLLSFVGDVELVPGCKNVSIAVSPSTDAVFMLDITRNHIVVMEPKTEELTSTK